MVTLTVWMLPLVLNERVPVIGPRREDCRGGRHGYGLGAVSVLPEAGLVVSQVASLARACTPSPCSRWWRWELNREILRLGCPPDVTLKAFSALNDKMAVPPPPFTTITTGITSGLLA